jgi:hypothetical protein
VPLSNLNGMSAKPHKILKRSILSSRGACCKMGSKGEAMYYALFTSSNANPLDIAAVGVQKGDPFRAGNSKAPPVDTVVSALHFTVEKPLSMIEIIA